MYGWHGGDIVNKSALYLPSIKQIVRNNQQLAMAIMHATEYKNNNNALDTGPVVLQ